VKKTLREKVFGALFLDKNSDFARKFIILSFIELTKTSCTINQTTFPYKISSSKFLLNKKEKDKTIIFNSIPETIFFKRKAQLRAKFE